MFNKKIQKGLSLIEASMVLVLSAVVVAGVMVYYQTAQTNNQLDKTSSQVMHIVSEVNGLYAGVSAKANGIYAGLDNDTLASSIADLETEVIQGQSLIKTAFNNIFITTIGMNYDPAKKTSDPNGIANHYMIVLSGFDNDNIAKLCQKIVSLNYSGEVDGYGFTDENGNDKIIDMTEPFSHRLTECQKFTGSGQESFSLVFK